MTLQKYFSHPSLVIYYFPTHKTKIETANRVETTNSKPPRPIIMFDQSKNREDQSDHIHYTLL